MLVASTFDDDHLAGLVGVLNFFPVERAIIGSEPTNTRICSSFLLNLEAHEIETLTPAVGDVFAFGDLELVIKWPLESSNSGWFDTDQIISLIQYKKTSFLIGGDTSESAWQELLEQDLRADVLLIREGDYNGFASDSWLNAVEPDIVVMSGGSKIDDRYGETLTINRLFDTGATVMRTSEAGTLQFQSDGEKIKPPLLAEVSSVVATEPQIVIEPEGENYVLNRNTHKFHYPYCRSVNQMKESNKWFVTMTRDEVINMGYDPCGNCRP
ncbi:MAG TPA: hypothetical protein GXZ89_02135 [Fastidiosipila sp.]|nr:hypothetical protein [Fastidiosipila sp.]